ncbi:MAG TPA: hypothetical protein VJ837_06575, partial [Candidatus Paceibacterota bacterium]|nr:hypothetical protein [Candidatus Paceibacterota bacterium]
DLMRGSFITITDIVREIYSSDVFAGWHEHQYRLEFTVTYTRRKTTVVVTDRKRSVHGFRYSPR